MIAGLRRAAVGVALVASLTLAGCASVDPTDVDPALSQELSASVVTVAQTAAGGDYATATSQLDDLTNQVNSAASDGLITGGRLVALQNAIATVRTDLQELIAAAEAAAAQAAAEEAQRQQEAADAQAAADAKAEADAKAAADAAKEAEKQQGPGKDNGGGPGKEKDNKGKP